MRLSLALCRTRPACEFRFASQAIPDSTRPRDEVRRRLRCGTREKSAGHGLGGSPMQSVMGLLQIGSFSWHWFHSNAGFQHERHREKKSVCGLERPSEKLDLRLCVCKPTMENSGGHARLPSVTEAQHSM